MSQVWQQNREKKKVTRWIFKCPECEKDLPNTIPAYSIVSIEYDGQYHPLDEYYDWHDSYVSEGDRDESAEMTCPLCGSGFMPDDIIEEEVIVEDR
jgi:hypothetical protein